MAIFPCEILRGNTQAQPLRPNPMRDRLLPTLVCLIMLTSLAPTASAMGPAHSSIWGLSYDWAHFEGDVENMTGVDTNAANEDLEDAAEYAGFTLETDQVLSGSSHFYIESWDESDIVEIQDIHGVSHQVSKRVTELTLRHGVLADAGFTMAWNDDSESIDVWYSASQEIVLVIDATYTEYVDSEMMVYGADLEMMGEVSDSAELSMNLQIIAAGEVEAPEIDLGYSLSMEIPSLSSEWRVDEPTDYLHALSDPTYSDSDSDDDRNDANDIIEGSYSTLTSYSLSVGMNGLPTEEFGINLDVFNVQLSDSVPGQGTFSDAFEVQSGAAWDWECPPVGGTESLTIDNATTEVQCGLAPPIPMGMAFMMGQSLMPAFDNGVSELSSVVQQQVESWIGEISGEGEGGVFVCDSGEEIPADWENDGEVDCSDGSDESDSSDTFTCDSGEVIPAHWENDGEEDCSDGSDENDGSSEAIEKYVDMFEALNNSNLQKTMEAFGEKLGELVEDNVPSEPVMDLAESCAILFWDTDESRVVGIAILNDEDADGSSELLLGPSIFGVRGHNVELNLEYHDGDDARDVKADILGLTEIRDIAPESKHDVEELYNILGPDFLPDLDQTDTDQDGVLDFFDEDDDGDGLFDWEDEEPLKPYRAPGEEEIDTVPGLGALAIASILGVAALLIPRREE